MVLDHTHATAPSFAYWLVMPAAGLGARMQAGSDDCPKQYRFLVGQTVIEHALAPFIDDPQCVGIVVALHAEDSWFSKLAVARHTKVLSTIGGATRRDSVLAGLQLLGQRSVAKDHWVWVHDAARPCVRRTDLDALKAALSAYPDVALLAVRVSDTLKRADHLGRVAATVPRDDVWRALTPQAFRLEALTAALQRCPTATDESSAMEASGFLPRLVAGASDNVKITEQRDLALAEQILRERSS